jgi:hypothetical protein
VNTPITEEFLGFTAISSTAGKVPQLGCRGITQGDIPSPTIFNIVCDAIIRTWKVGVTDGHITSSDGGGAINEEIAAMLYANDGLLASNQPTT